MQSLVQEDLGAKEEKFRRYLEGWREVLALATLSEDLGLGLRTPMVAHN